MHKKSLLVLLAVAMLAFCESAGAQPAVTGNNGVLGFNLNSYGRFRVSKAPYSAGAREVDRMSFIAALDPKNVFDYNEDANVTAITAQSITIAGVDTAFACVTDNSFTGRPPKIRVRHTVYAWKNTGYVIIRYSAINDTSITVGLYPSAAILTRPSGTYGGETLDYNAAKATAYYFRSGENPHWGIRLLNKATYSVTLRDWDAYSSDPNSDAATDSTRYVLATASGFDAAVTVGANSGILHVNAGLSTLAPGDSAVVFYAVAFGNNLSDMLTASDAAKAKYDALLTAVAESSGDLPSRFALRQNYPNPFNPSTEIKFDLAQRGRVSLKIYDAMGREVQTLVDRTLAAGAHTYTFEAASLRSGIYFYTLRTNTFTATRKMLFMR